MIAPLIAHQSPKTRDALDVQLEDEDEAEGGEDDALYGCDDASKTVVEEEDEEKLVVDSPVNAMMAAI